uniref:RAP domain-containing protein n=1 Tax=Chromera velia CCMP2878 TaxID=1169474 RepID=A0A0G4GK97_9ALVE|eukprot:Cvel_22290.t1-p1 / transcript=Cvel_22290.t1 / gene=Cvel_22290 / organism=Chromera_velia_CCMP2878 / gene_product=hypothetical protein / transcript_product=hypothetical protein / location=Cvel_scaffold2177:148-1954(+) / protein_length=258 / sequence_SO=supercontig / SO=protein_coding / is_pseudo=false
MPWPPLDTTGRALETVSEVDFLVRRAESLVTSLCKELGICPRLASLASRAFQESGNGNKNLLWDSSEMGEGIGGRGGMDFRSSPDFLVSSTMHAKASEALEAEGLEHRHEVLLGSLLGIRVDILLMERRQDAGRREKDHDERDGGDRRKEEEDRGFSSSGVPTVVEIDGPSHFCMSLEKVNENEKEKGGVERGGKGQMGSEKGGDFSVAGCSVEWVPSGREVLKFRILNALGIPHYHFPVIGRGAHFALPDFTTKFQG